MDEIKCPVCEGSFEKAQFLKINENITELCDMDIGFDHLV
jgi:uncharacterized protein (DUF2225 family)